VSETGRYEEGCNRLITGNKTDEQSSDDPRYLQQLPLVASVSSLQHTCRIALRLYRTAAHSKYARNQENKLSKLRLESFSSIMLSKLETCNALTITALAYAKVKSSSKATNEENWLL